MIDVQILTLPHGRGLALPGQATAEAAGFDIAAAEELTIAPGSVAAIATGFALAIPAGFEGQVRPRSGLALRHGVTVLNAPGTIDADYRGEIQVLLVNFGAESFFVNRGLRIAQLVVTPVLRAHVAETKKLNKTKRGEKGFGSTGQS
jgi:dUTP pyrophosphatase